MTNGLRGIGRGEGRREDDKKKGSGEWKQATTGKNDIKMNRFAYLKAHKKQFPVLKP